MHERTQRAIARLLFVFTCAVPTAMTLVYVLITWTPWFSNRILREIEADISLATRLEVQIEDYKRLSPTRLRIYDIKLADLETHEPVASVREVYWDSSPASSLIQLREPKLYSSQFASTWTMIHDGWLCRPENTQHPTRLDIRGLTIENKNSVLKMESVQGWSRPQEDAVKVAVECREEANPDTPPLSIRVTRDRSGAVPGTSWELDTGGTPLPCSALSGYLPALEALGPAAVFSGRMRWQTDTNWWIDLGGSRFENVQLEGLTSHTNRLTGNATVELSHCYIAPGEGRSEFAGTLRAREGLIAKALLRGTQDFLRFRLNPAIQDDEDDVFYDQLAIAFSASGSQLTLDGICQGFEYPDYPNLGVVLARDGIPIVTSTHQSIFAVDVVTAIAPRHSVLVPIARQTQWLLRMLVPAPDRPVTIGEPAPRVGLIPSNGLAPTDGEPAPVGRTYLK